MSEPGNARAREPLPAEPGSVRIERPEPIIRVDDIAYVMFEKPDLEQSERFFRDFGLFVSERSSDALYLRGAGERHHVYVAYRGEEPRFRGLAFEATSRDDLDTLAARTGRRVEAISEPGGGERVRLEDPHGFVVDVIHGQERLPELPTRRKPLPINTPWDKPRVNVTQRPPLEPSTVVRLGHCAIGSTRFEEAVDWYMRHLGLLASDVQCTRDGTPLLVFMRLDRGKQPADHHAFVVGTGLADEYLHCAFEVLDIDTLGQGQQVLKAGGWKHSWGIARHLLGSQLFDYWKDPDGFEVEHYADGDVFDDTWETDYHEMDRAFLWQWGVDMPGDFIPRPSPLAVVRAVLDGTLKLSALPSLARALGTKPRPWLR